VAKRERLILRQVADILFTFVGVGIVLAERGLRWQGTSVALGGDVLMLLTALCGGNIWRLSTTDAVSLFCSDRNYVCDVVRNFPSLSSRSC